MDDSVLPIVSEFKVVAFEVRNPVETAFTVAVEPDEIAFVIVNFD